MMEFLWSPDKNNRLKADTLRCVCFEDVVSAIESGGLLDDVAHPNKMKYPHQRILVVLFSGYVYAVPYVRQDDGVLFLKTVYPSRAFSRAYLIGDLDEE